MKRCGLLGEKLGHSYSPAIHAELADYEYRLYEVAPEKLGEFLTGGGFDGMNVTIPYKKAVIPYCAELSPIAQKLQSVNVLVRREDGTLYDLSALEQKDKYELFLGGNYGQCVITTGTENGKHLLLVKDSFANSFVPFLTGDYETITMIDLRYYRGSMAELAAEADDILVLTEVTNLAGSGDYFKLSK